ncbi:M14 family metallopeptidase [Nocardiopsis alkaliphila]|uniref:M14 family metallopeptidase n=1 Tax=Nocardiopsis alkaliphila TaxID=225762 RepID=UPI0003479EC2|nr:M14 family metallopeptidase [Nocardiopsis alkaliphila]
MHHASPSPFRRSLVPVAVGALLLGTLATGSATAEPGYGLYEIDGVTTPEERSEIAATGVAIDHVGEDSVLITGSTEDLDELDSLGYAARAFEPARTLASPDPGYTTYPELLEIIDQVVTDHPGIAAREVFGRSHEGRDLVAVKISDNVTVDEDRPEVLFVHSQHAREHLTVEMAVYLLHLLTDGYGEEPRITELVDGREIWILPNVNPDGSEYDMAGDTWRNWRKNRQPNEGSSAIGTDMNRNWAYNWGCCGGSSGNPSGTTYRGDAPESATEVKAVADFVRGRVVDGEQQITAAIDFHTYSELILWPFGHTYDETTGAMTQEEYDTHRALGEYMAEANGYTPQQSSDLYITDGSINDWLWADQGIVNFTYEMYPRSASGGGFYPPSSVIERETSRNEEAVLRLLDYADCPYRIIGEQDAYCG